ncbi:MAG TPA: M56 family metallopeptidase [Solirubrobacterales bacterium]|nr:M56 family metallopeptidase [Solirubrobacterales bacterium]
MSSVFAAAAIALAISAAGRLLPLERVAAPTAIAFWLCVLAVGAITTVAAATLAIVYLPETAIYAIVTEFCVHVTLPVISPHVGFSGHAAIHAAMALPVLGILASLLWLMSRLTNGWWELRSRLRGSLRTARGVTLIEDDEIVIGVSPLGRSRIVVSDTAIRVLDPGELQAGLSHEAGHIRRGHRSILLLSGMLVAVGFAFPGTRRAQRSLRQALERDADAYAVRQTRDPLALASAICKAAVGPGPAGGLGLAGGAVSRRLDYLDGGLTLAGPAVRWSMRLVTSIFALATVLFAAAVLAWMAEAPGLGHVWSLNGIC